MKSRAAGWRVTRRHLQLGLALLWLLDAGLQAQPFMFSKGFARDIIAPAGAGQPVGVAAPVHWAASIVAAHPVLGNTGFVVVQALLGVLLLSRRSARLGLAGSVIWGLLVWWLGEGLGGISSGGTLLSGGPGAALLYAAVAVVAWPSRKSDGDEPARAAVVVPIWVAFWASGAVLGSPAPALVGLYVLVALWSLLGGAWSRVSAVMGAGIAIGAWVTVQSFGELTTGQATDPNSAPLILLLALGLPFATGLAGRPAASASRVTSTGAVPAHT